MLGFDWADYQNETTGVVADMNVVFLPIPPQPGQQVSTLDNFLTTEALSGSAFGDTLLGDDLTQVDLQANGGVLSGADRISLITGLQALLGAGVTTFDGGNIILGGGGSDRITGRGGNDIIDGDAWLNVQLRAPNLSTADPNDFARYNSMTELQAAAFAGALDPGDISIVREILHSSGPNDVDTAVFSGNMGDYMLGFGGTGGTFDGSITVTDLRGIDGVDTLRNIERLQFADQLVVLSANGNALPTGLLSISDTTPAQGQTLTASVGNVRDLDNPNGGIVTPTIYFWQVANPLNPTVFTDVAVNGSGPTFIVTAAEAGQILRVRAQYTDAHGVTEEVFSAPTAVVANINDAPVGRPTISDTTPTEGQVLSVANTFTDADGITLTGPNATVFSYQWQLSTGTNIAGATGQTFAPTATQVGQGLRVIVTYTDNLGGANSVTSDATGPVAGAIRGTAANNDPLNGTAADDTILGLGGNDRIFGLDGNDLIDGGLGNDILNGQNGNDSFIWRLNEGVDSFHGGAGLGDNVNIFGGAGTTADTLNVVWNGTAVTGFGGVSAVTNVERIAADLGAGVDTINFSTSTAAVTLNLSGLASGLTVISNIENATGTNFADTLIGNAAANVLIGNSGADRITGGAGNDRMSAGSGSDTFFFGVGFGVDTITDFDSDPGAGRGAGFDLLNVHDLGINAGNFAARVNIAVVGTETQVTIDGNVIHLLGVTGVGTNAVTIADFSFV
jgi:hypothetical protein